MTEHDFRTIVKRFVTEQGGPSRAARKIGVSPTTLSLFLHGRQHAGRKIPAYFGMFPAVSHVYTVSYVPVGKRGKAG